MELIALYRRWCIKLIYLESLMHASSSHVYEYSTIKCCVKLNQKIRVEITFADRGLWSRTVSMQIVIVIRNQKTVVFSLLCSGNWAALHDKYEWNTHIVNNNWRSKIHRRGYAYQAILFSSAFLVKPQGSNSGNSMSLPTSSLDAPSSLMERL